MKTHKRALIIDDDVDLCILLKTLLLDLISEVKYAHTLEDGIRLLPSLKPDVIFLDNNLPDGQGVAFIQDMKLISPSSSLILISAVDNFKENSSRDEQGMDVFLPKPLTRELIVKALEMVHK